MDMFYIRQKQKKLENDANWYYSSSTNYYKKSAVLYIIYSIIWYRIDFLNKVTFCFITYITI